MISDTPWGTLYKGSDRTHIRHLHGFVLTIRRERTQSIPTSSHDFVRPCWRWVGHVTGEGLPENRGSETEAKLLREAKEDLERAAGAWLAYVERER